MKGVVITGPTGAIGMALIHNCIDNKIPVLAICHRGSSRISQIPDSSFVKVVEASLNEYGNIGGEITEGVHYDTFIHLAWNGTFGNTRNDMFLQSDNIRYALEACELAKRLGCSVFIGAGSQAEYGRVSEPLRPDTPAFPENGYGIAKLAAGQMSRIRCEQLGLKHIWTRILSIYGPYDGDYTMVMSSLIKMLNNEETHFTAGDQIWDYLYSGDAAKMLLFLADNGENGKVYIIGNGESRPLKEFIQLMYESTGSAGRLGLGDIPYGPNTVMKLCVDSNCVVEYGEPKVSFTDGIKATISYIKNKS